MSKNLNLRLTSYSLCPVAPLFLSVPMEIVFYLPPRSAIAAGLPAMSALL